MTPSRHALLGPAAAIAALPRAARAQGAYPAHLYRGVLVAAVVLAVAASLVAGHDAASGGAAEAAGLELTRVLRFMALVKAAAAAGALWLVDWRLRHPATPVVAASYIAACALMVAGPGLIWSITHVALGATAFHAGVALLLVLGWTDRASLPGPTAGIGEARGRRPIQDRPAALTAAEPGQPPFGSV